MKLAWVHVPEFQSAMLDPQCGNLQHQINRLLGELSPGDMRELDAMGETPDVIFRAQDVNLGYVNGRLECVFGFEVVEGCPDNGWTAYISPWLLGTGSYGKGVSRRAFFLQAKALVDHYTVPMCNAVHSTNTQAHKFIEFLGFTIHRDHPFTAETGETFWSFTKNV